MGLVKISMEKEKLRIVKIILKEIRKCKKENCKRCLTEIKKKIN